MIVPDDRVPSTGRVGWVKHEIDAMLSTDEQYEEVIAYLQSKVKVSLATHLALELLREEVKNDKEILDFSEEELHAFFFETDASEEVKLQLGIWDDLDLDYIFKELHKDEQ